MPPEYAARLQRLSQAAEAVIASSVGRGGEAFEFLAANGRPLGDAAFLARIEARLGRSLAPKRPGPKPTQVPQKEMSLHRIRYHVPVIPALRRLP